MFKCFPRGVDSVLVGVGEYSNRTTEWIVQGSTLDFGTSICTHAVDSFDGGNAAEASS